jgi:hypothetical protein
MNRIAMRALNERPQKSGEKKKKKENTPKSTGEKGVSGCRTRKDGFDNSFKKYNEEKAG